MNVKEFWNLVDSIDVDSREDGKYTKDELYAIGCAFINLDNSEKRSIGGWNKLVEILHPTNSKDEYMKSGEEFRLWIKNQRNDKEELPKNIKLLSGRTIKDITFSEFEDKTEEIKRDLYKERVRVSDTYNSYRRVLREEARVDSMKDIISEAVSKLANLPNIEYTLDIGDCSSEAVMLISDMHVGMQIDNFANKYNAEIAKKRLMAYVDETIRLCNDNHVKRLNVVNLNDLIHGLIHITGRIEEQSDVIEQIMTASEYLSEALIKLQEAAPEIIYRSVTDNHSRAIPSFKENIEKENFSRLIDFYLESRLKGTNIVFANDNLDVDISKIELLNGKTMICSHGHRDNLNTIIQGYIGATKKFIDYVCVGHFHDSKMKSFQGAKVFVNGSLCGVDSYAASKRLFGDPEQTLLIFNGMTLSQHIVNLKDVK